MHIIVCFVYETWNWFKLVGVSTIVESRSELFLNQPVLRKEDTLSWSRKQWEPLMGFEASWTTQQQKGVAKKGNLNLKPIL